MTQRLLPISDLQTDAGWTSTGASFYTEVDETIFSTDDDSTYVRDDGAENAVLLMGLSAGIDPISSTGHIIRVRARSEIGTPLTTLQVWLDPVGILMSISLKTSYDTYEYTLSGAEADSITDYTALTIRMLYGEFELMAARVSAIEFAFPDASSTKSPIFQQHPSQRALLRR